MLCTRPVVGRHCVFKIHEMGSGSFKIILNMKKGAVSEGFDRGEKCMAVGEAPGKAGDWQEPRGKWRLWGWGLRGRQSRSGGDQWTLPPARSLSMGL